MRSFAFLLAALTLAGPLQALNLAECTRTTHVSHGGEMDHADLGEGRVIWQEWWSQEGSALWVRVMDCREGRMMSALTAEENMNARAPFNRTQAVLDLIARHETGARVFATLGRMADELDPFARDVTVAMVSEETCACAVFYPDLRGDKTAFVLERL